MYGDAHINFIKLDKKRTWQWIVRFGPNTYLRAWNYYFVFYFYFFSFVRLLWIIKENKMKNKNLCVDKPKWKCIYRESEPEDWRKRAFCMHCRESFVKLTTNQIIYWSNYCLTSNHCVYEYEWEYRACVCVCVWVNLIWITVPIDV